MAKFNSKSAGIKTRNLAGGKAYSMSVEYELATLVLTSFNENKFYESASDQNKRLVKLAEKADKDFLGNLALFARKEFHMRSVSHVLLAELARLHKGEKEIIKAGIERLDDMNEIVAYYGNKYGKPIPNSIKKAVREKLVEFDAYQLGKYKSANKDVKLVDLFNLVHPKPKNKEQEEMWGKLLKGKLESPETWEVLISTAQSDEERARAWERLIMEGKLGYMAMLRNARNLDKYKVSNSVIDRACSVIADRERVKKSKQLPFRFWSAYNNAPNTRFKDAISVAMDYAVDNIPKLEGKTAIVIDVSGSMCSSLSGRSEVTYVDIARLFGCALFKANPYDSEVYGFDDQVYSYNLSSRTPVIDMINSINANGGSTDLWKVFEYFIQAGKRFDRVIVLSDMQAWDSSGWHRSTQESFGRWKSALNITPKVYSIDLAGHGTSEFGEVSMISGWSEKIFTIMKVLEQDKDALINIIKNYEVSEKTTIYSH